MDMTVIGITGTDGAGKGEKAWEAFARPCQLVCDVRKQTSDKVYCACKAPVPATEAILTTNIDIW